MRLMLQVLGKILLFIAWCVELSGIMITLFCLREFDGIFVEGIITLIFISAMFIFTSFSLGKKLN